MHIFNKPHFRTPVLHMHNPIGPRQKPKISNNKYIGVNYLPVFGVLALRSARTKNYDKKKGEI